jgi:hypothetical protein
MEPWDQRPNCRTKFFALPEPAPSCFEALARPHSITGLGVRGPAELERLCSQRGLGLEVVSSAHISPPLRRLQATGTSGAGEQFKELDTLLLTLVRS